MWYQVSRLDKQAFQWARDALQAQGDGLCQAERTLRSGSPAGRGQQPGHEDLSRRVKGALQIVLVLTLVCHAGQPRRCWKTPFRHGRGAFEVQGVSLEEPSRQPSI